MIKAILLDFNGVIVDDEPIQMRAYQEVMSNEGIDLTEESYYECLGMNDEAFITTIYERAEKEMSREKLIELVEAKTAKWKEIINDNIPLFYGVDEFLKRMKNKFTLGLVSMARRIEIDYIFENTGLEECFAVLVSAEDVSTTKPDPECYRKGFKLVDAFRTSKGKNPITHKQCVVIEDSPQGIISGRTARLKTLGVVNTVDAKELRAAGADAVTENLNDWSPESFNRVF